MLLGRDPSMSLRVGAHLGLGPTRPEFPNVRFDLDQVQRSACCASAGRAAAERIGPHRLRRGRASPKDAVGWVALLRQVSALSEPRVLDHGGSRATATRPAAVPVAAPTADGYIGIRAIMRASASAAHSAKRRADVPPPWYALIGGKTPASYDCRSFPGFRRATRGRTH
jgi:hypothetical protein